MSKLNGFNSDIQQVFAALSQNSPDLRCKFCGKEAIFSPTKLCYDCWQVATKLRIFLDTTKGRHFVRSLLNEVEDILPIDEIPEVSVDLTTQDTEMMGKLI